MEAHGTATALGDSIDPGAVEAIGLEMFLFDFGGELSLLAMGHWHLIELVMAGVVLAGGSISEARTEVYRTINKIVMPNLFYRSDIGQRVEQHDLPLLKDWGWL